MNASEIMGREVLDKKANRIGKVTDLDIDVTKGAINFLTVKIGMTKKLNIPTANVERAGDKVILNVSKEELEAMLAPTR